MGYKKIEQSDSSEEITYKSAKAMGVGSQIEGTYVKTIGSKKYPAQVTYIIRDADEKLIGLNATMQLKECFEQVKAGNKVRLTLAAMDTLDNGNNFARWDVEVDNGETPF